MPEGSGLGGVNREVWIVLMSLRCTTLRADAGGAAQSSAPSAATRTAPTRRHMPADNVCRPGLGQPTPLIPVPLMPQRIRLAGGIYAGKNERRGARPTAPGWQTSKKIPPSPGSGAYLAPTACLTQLHEAWR